MIWSRVCHASCSGQLVVETPTTTRYYALALFSARLLGQVIRRFFICSALLRNVHQDSDDTRIQVLSVDSSPNLTAQTFADSIQDRDQTQIEPFSPRHNVVVGRNGSGKSNFFAGESPFRVRCGKRSKLGIGQTAGYTPFASPGDTLTVQAEYYVVLLCVLWR